MTTASTAQVIEFELTREYIGAAWVAVPIIDGIRQGVLAAKIDLDELKCICDDYRANGGRQVLMY